MEIFQLILYILAAVLVSSFISRFIPRVSTPLVQIALGALLAELSFLPTTQLDPELFMVVFIAPLLYAEAHRIDKQSLLKNLGLSLSLAVGLVLLTMVVVGLALYVMWPLISLSAAFALGAALGPTDAVAVSSLGGEASLSSYQRSVLEGESLFNDASGVIGFQFSILAATTGTFSLPKATSQFILSFAGGVILGMATGLIANWLFEWVRSMGWETVTSRILMELFLPFLIYLGAERLAHISGILAVVTAGLLIRFDRTGIGPNVARTNIVSNSVWSVLSFSLNGAVFILLGMQLPLALKTSWNNPVVSNSLLLEEIAIISLIVVGLRFLWVTFTTLFHKHNFKNSRFGITQQGLRSAAIMTFGGPKGAVTLALMFTIPFSTSSSEAFFGRSELIFVATGVIVVTLLMANFLLPVLAPRSNNSNATKITEVAIAAVRQTITELSQRVTNENRRAVLLVIDSNTKRIERMKQNLGVLNAETLEQLQIATLNWEKEYLEETLAQAQAEESLFAKIPAQGKDGDSTNNDAMAPDPPAEGDDGKSRKKEQKQYMKELEMRIEASGSLLNQVLKALSHTGWTTGHRQFISPLPSRLMILRRRYIRQLRRLGYKFSRTTPRFKQNEYYTYSRNLQIKVIRHVIDQLYRGMKAGKYTAEDCSSLLSDYRRAEADLRERTGRPDNTGFVNQLEEVKHESYAIELSVIQNMYEEGAISRAQAKQLRNNVYVMQVEADSSL